MTFSRANASGWGFNTKLTAAQANTIDLNQSRAVDGYAGGNYTPSSPVWITGFRFTSASANSVSSGGSCTVDSGATLACSAGSVTTLAGKVAIGVGATTPGSNTTNIAGTVAYQSGTWTCASGAAFVFNCTTAINNVMTVTRRIQMDTGGHVVDRATVTLNDADQTVGIANGDAFKIPATTGNRTYTLADIDENGDAVSNGTRVRVKAFGMTAARLAYVVDYGGGGALVTLAEPGTSGGVSWADFRVEGGHWVLDACGEVHP